MICIIHVSPRSLSTTSWQKIKQFQGETRCFGIMPGMTSCSHHKSEAFKTYRAYATGEKAPKSKVTKKKTDSESSPKIKPSQASKGDGVDILSKVPDENNKPDLVQMKELVTNQRFPMYPNTNQRVKKNPGLSRMDSLKLIQMRMEMILFTQLSTYIADDQEKEKEEEKADDDDDDVTSDQKNFTKRERYGRCGCLLKSDKIREEAQAENQDFLHSLDFNMKKIIKEQVEATKESGRKSHQKKQLKRSQVYKFFKGTTRSLPKSSGKSVQEEEHDPRVEDLEDPFH
ncbi:hypothetical protein Tco_0223181 [Tanacetum coccineum]